MGPKGPQREIVKKTKKTHLRSKKILSAMQTPQLTHLKRK